MISGRFHAIWRRPAFGNQAGYFFHLDNGKARQAMEIATKEFLHFGNRVEKINTRLPSAEKMVGSEWEMIIFVAISNDKKTK
jgi:hypothetical protein